MQRLLIALLLTYLVGACTVTPDYQRPELDIPKSFGPEAPSGASIANLAWWDLFQDEQLDLLIRTALAQNKDRGIALSRVEEARYTVTAVRANQFPFIDVSGFLGRERWSRALTPGARSDNRFLLSGDLSYQIDLWGEFRRATQAARADLLATESAYRNITILLVSEVARTYLLLRSLDARLAISERTLDTRLKSLDIIQARFDKGTVSKLDVHQAQIEVAVAEVSIAAFQRLVVQTQNALRALLGRNPGPITRGESLDQQTFPPDIPTGLPSELLQRRPDIVQAEARLEAATARVGVAEALRYPSIALTGRYGVESTDLSDLNASDARTWSIGANILGPIFNSGQLKAQADATRARAEQALLVYEAALQQSLREVEDALVAVRTFRTEHEAQARRAKAATEAARLSRARYDGGVVDYLEVLDTERTLFNAELEESLSLQQYYSAIVQLYAALGGGWSVAE
ncbi:MAG: efflux transporter outer membrane subunit [Halioglobus sp.]|nr:efflux transporter outer membrane subunit [Halioglobus sp.]